MDGHRRYAEEPEQSGGWYTGSTNPYDSGVYERPSGAFRLPDQRPVAEEYPGDPVTSTGSHARPVAEPPAARTSVRGPEYPAVRPSGATSLADAPRGHSGGSAAPASGLPAQAMAYNEPTSLVPPVPAPERGRESVYSTRRPVSAVLVAIATVLLMVPVVRLLLDASFTGDPSARLIVPAVLLTLGLPLTGAGLYALAGGGRPHNRDTWLRPPVAYLPTGLFLVLAAALAVA